MRWPGWRVSEGEWPAAMWWPGGTCRLANRYHKRAKQNMGSILDPAPGRPVPVVIQIKCHTKAEALHCKKDEQFSCPQLGCHLPNSPWAGIIKLFPARKSLISDTPRLGTGKSLTFFYSVEGGWEGIEQLLTQLAPIWLNYRYFLPTPPPLFHRIDAKAPSDKKSNYSSVHNSIFSV